jgi:4-hydroxyphenylacetate 3-monooxygenase
MTFDIGNGRRANRAWQLPRSYAELVERRKALTAWSEQHVGFMGRSPDHVASCISAMAMRADVFEAHGKGRGQAVLDYYHHARDNDLYLAYVIIDPQADAPRPPAGPTEQNAAICDETPGITIKAPRCWAPRRCANLVLVSLRPVRDGDDKYAFTAMVPIGARA